MAWRWAAASEMGSYHRHSDGRLEDAYAVAAPSEGVCIAIVADGAGSAEYGAQGAWLSVRCLKLRLSEWFAVTGELPEDEILRGWFDGLRDHIAYVANQRGSTSRQFAATISVLAIAPSGVLAAHIGDSGVVGRQDNAWESICWPDMGEFASSTYFVTDDPEPRIHISRPKGDYDGFALFTDGVGDLALSFVESAPFAGFLDPIMRPVDGSLEAGRMATLSERLAEYLAGPAVSARVDDDKTLILLSRR